jgi:hypothetical protein
MNNNSNLINKQTGSKACVISKADQKENVMKMMTDQGKNISSRGEDRN